jgi:glycerol-3-phosphate acyltransferase PlsY
VKGLIAVLVAKWLSYVPDVNGALLVQIAGISVIVGHIFPIYFKFKGGKGVATSLGILLLVNLQIGLICLLFALAIMVLTRMVSLGSITAALLFPILTLFNIGKEYYLEAGEYLIFSIICAVIVWYTHRENIKRIMNGTESRIGQKVV